MNDARLKAWAIYFTGLVVIALLPAALSERWAVLCAALVGYVIGATLPDRWRL